MNDVCGLIIPNKTNLSEILLADVYELKKISSTAFEVYNISFMDKLIIINEINSSKDFQKNVECAFIPFFMVKNMNLNDNELVLNFLNKIVDSPPKIEGSLYFSNRIVMENSISYKFVMYFTEPIDPSELKIKHVFWCDKKDLKLFHSVHNYYNLGDELESILPVKNPNKYQSSNETCLIECRLNPYCTYVPKASSNHVTLLQKMITETKTDLFTQSYLYADFMVNSYPCKVMKYPQFIGFGVARGLYVNRVLKIFNVLLEDNTSYLTFERFLYGCLCMDLSSEHTNSIRIARGDLIFKYYDKNNDDILDFNEMSCLVKRMRKKMNYNDDSPELRNLTEHIVESIQLNSRLQNTYSTNNAMVNRNITREEFMKSLSNPELSGLTNLFRFSLPYIKKANYFMKQYLETSGINIFPSMFGQHFNLIPYFIEEAYSKDELFKSMLFYSQSYDNVQDLLYKLDDMNKMALVKYKGLNVLSNFFSQLFYYFSEILFDIYNREGVFPWRNPLFLTLVVTVMAIVYPSLFHISPSFWNRVLAFFSTSLPASYFFVNHFNQDDRDRSIGFRKEAKDTEHWLNLQNKYEKRRKEIEQNDLDDEEDLTSPLGTSNRSGITEDRKRKLYRKRSQIDPNQPYDDNKYEKRGIDETYRNRNKDIKSHDKLNQNISEDDYDLNDECVNQRTRSECSLDRKSKQKGGASKTCEETLKSNYKKCEIEDFDSNEDFSSKQNRNDCSHYIKRDNVFTEGSDKLKSNERCEKANEHEQTPHYIRESFKISKKEMGCPNEKICEELNENEIEDCQKSVSQDSQRFQEFTVTEKHNDTLKCYCKFCKRSSK